MYTYSCFGLFQSSDTERFLTLNGFLQFVFESALTSSRCVWRGLFACGFDLDLQRFRSCDAAAAQQLASSWSEEADIALVAHVNATCRHLAIAPARMHAHEIYVTSDKLTSCDFSALQGVAMEAIRVRFALLQFLNNALETFLLPLIDLRPCLQSGSYDLSTAALLARSRSRIFYDTKMQFLNRVINATARRKADQPAPEINLDPLQTISPAAGTGQSNRCAGESFFCSAMRQLAAVPSQQLCVRLAAGGDPTYSFNVHFAGEEVHGTSGSFRHFVHQVARELQGGVVDLLVTSPSCGSDGSSRKYVLKPGAMTFAGERMLVFLGQVRKK